MHVEAQIAVATHPEHIFKVYADVANWCKWDPDTKSSSIDGPFETGASGRIAPPKGFELPMTFVSVVPNKSFTVEAKLPLFKMVFEHELKAAHDMTLVRHRVTFSGPLTFILGRVIGDPLKTGLPTTLKSLKQYVERAALAA